MQTWEPYGTRMNSEKQHVAALLFLFFLLGLGPKKRSGKRLEEYFGLPSQREPAGHVPAPALLATRINSQAGARGGGEN